MVECILPSGKNQIEQLTAVWHSTRRGPQARGQLLRECAHVDWVADQEKMWKVSIPQFHAEIL